MNPNEPELSLGFENGFFIDLQNHPLLKRKKQKELPGLYIQKKVREAYPLLTALREGSLIYTFLASFMIIALGICKRASLISSDTANETAQLLFFTSGTILLVVGILVRFVQGAGLVGNWSALLGIFLSSIHFFYLYQLYVYHKNKKETDGQLKFWAAAWVIFLVSMEIGKQLGLKVTP